VSHRKKKTPFEFILAIAAMKPPRPNSREILKQLIERDYYSIKTNYRDSILQIDKYLEFVHDLEKILTEHSG